MKKTYAFKYKDTISTESVVNSLGETEDNIQSTNENHGLYIEYNVAENECYIYSDEEIAGLELLETDVIVEVTYNDGQD